MCSKTFMDDLNTPIIDEAGQLDLFTSAPGAFLHRFSTKRSPLRLQIFETRQMPKLPSKVNYVIPHTDSVTP